MAVAPIVVETGVVIVAVTAAVEADGAAVVGAIAADARRRVPELAVAISRLPNTLLRKAAKLAVTSRAVTIIVATITVAVISEVRKIAAARHGVLNLAAQHNAASIIVRRKLPVPPHPNLSRKSPFFSRANLSPSIVPNLSPHLRRRFSNRNRGNRSPKSKTLLPSRPLA